MTEPAAAGTSAATAAEAFLRAVGDSFDSGTNTLQLPAPGWLPLEFDGAGTEQWYRVRLDLGGAAWSYVAYGGGIYPYTGAQTAGQYTHTSYVSTDPGEDGSTLVLLGEESASALDATNYTRDTLGDRYAWLYVQVTPVEPFEAESAALTLGANGGITTDISGTRHASTYSVTGTTTATVRSRFVIPSSVDYGGAGTQVSVTALIAPPVPGVHSARTRGTTTVTAVATVAEPVIEVSGNDTLANAYALTHGTQATGTTPTLTQDALEPLPMGMGPHTAWFTWVAPRSQSYEFTTHGSDFDTILALYTSSAEPASYATMTEIGRGDDSPGGDRTSFVDVTLTAGTKVYIQVGGYASYVGRYLLNYPRPAAVVTSPVTITATPDVVTGATTVRFARGAARPQQVVGSTRATVTLTGLFVYPDESAGSTQVSIIARPVVIGVPEPVLAATTVRVLYTPDLSSNPPIDIAFDSYAELELIAPVDADPDDVYDAEYA